MKSVKSTIERIDPIEIVGRNDSLDIHDQLDELRNLADGWLNGDGIALKKDGLDWLAQSFDRYYPTELPLPYIFPTAEGGVQAEWFIPKFAVSIEINIEKHNGEFLLMNHETGKDIFINLNLDTLEDWNWLVNQLHTIAGVAV
jgi:hypothetical protein